MKIAAIRAAPLRDQRVLGRSGEPGTDWFSESEGDNPLSRYERYRGQGARFRPPWPEVVCVVTADDGTWGVGMTAHAGPVVPLVNDYLAPVLREEPALETERLWDVMAHAVAASFGTTGVASYALSAIDLALWDLRGKAAGRPVYELIGGPKRAALDCYVTGDDVTSYRALGFEAFKLPCPAGAADGAAGVEIVRETVASARAEIGSDAALMLDLWGVQDAGFAIAVGEATREHELGWLEDYVYPDSWSDYREVRDALRGVALAAGEKWYTAHPFRHAAELGVIDVLQPDICWVGGLTPTIEIADVARAAGLELALHLGGNDSYGQHACLALPHYRWSEFYMGGAPPENLMDAYRGTPGMALPVNGRIVPSDAPGFGIELTLDQIEAAT